MPVLSHEAWERAYQTGTCKAIWGSGQLLLCSQCAALCWLHPLKLQRNAVRLCEHQEKWRLCSWHSLECSTLRQSFSFQITHVNLSRGGGDVAKDLYSQKWHCVQDKHVTRCATSTWRRHFWWRCWSALCDRLSCMKCILKFIWLGTRLVCMSLYSISMGLFDTARLLVISFLLFFQSLTCFFVAIFVTRLLWSFIECVFILSCLNTSVPVKRATLMVASSMAKLMMYWSRLHLKVHAVL